MSWFHTHAHSEFAWLAGLIEGEGHFRYQRGKGKASFMLAVAMKDRDVVERCQEITGLGSVMYREDRAWPDGGYVWRCDGVKGYAVMVMLWPWLGERRRQQVEQAVAAWKLVPVGNKNKTHCPRGHEYDYVDGEGRRRCRACTNRLWKEAAARRAAR